VTIRPGDEWGTPTEDPADIIVRGDDRTLAAALADLDPTTLVDFRPDAACDFARAVGLGPGEGPRRGVAAPIDGMDLVRAGSRSTVVNALEFGTPPGSLRALARTRTVTVTVDGRTLHRGPATGVVVANGQFVDGLDVSPRGHPGDGRLEVQVYALRPGERGGMRQRLATGSHLPHPRIRTGTGRRIRVRVEGGGWPVRVDGEPSGRSGALEVAVRSPAAHLLL
jgi:hypothetical protein